MGTKASKVNPRYANGTLRRKHRARLKAIGAPCGICGGIIHYDEPSDAKHPLSFVVDEIRPISRYKEFGYRSKREAAEDFSNLQAAHYCCNLAKSNRTQKEMQSRMSKTLTQTQMQATIGTVLDGDW